MNQGLRVMRIRAPSLLRARETLSRLGCCQDRGPSCDLVWIDHHKKLRGWAQSQPQSYHPEPHGPGQSSVSVKSERSGV